MRYPYISSLYFILLNTLNLEYFNNQIWMKEEDIEKTAFACREGLLEFLRMPFGLVNAPATFQRAMNRVLRPFLNKYVMVYMNDIIIYSKGADKHKEHVDAVLKRIHEVGMVLNKEKCEYGKKELGILGHIVSKEDKGGSREDPSDDRTRDTKDQEGA